MRLLGHANWWLPEPLAGLYRRYGIQETPPVAVEPLPEPVAV
jgi:RND superfamily putative drug exporter